MDNKLRVQRGTPSAKAVRPIPPGAVIINDLPWASGLGIDRVSTPGLGTDLIHGGGRWRKRTTPLE